MLFVRNNRSSIQNMTHFFEKFRRDQFRTTLPTNKEDIGFNPTCREMRGCGCEQREHTAEGSNTIPFLHSSKVVDTVKLQKQTVSIQWSDGSGLLVFVLIKKTRRVGRII